jgi:hypothetical protein
MITQGVRFYKGVRIMHFPRDSRSDIKPPATIPYLLIFHGVSAGSLEDRSVTDAKHADAGLLRSCERGFSSCVGPKRSEHRSAVDRAFGRAK